MVAYTRISELCKDVHFNSLCLPIMLNQVYNLLTMGEM